MNAHNPQDLINEGVAFLQQGSEDRALERFDTALAIDATMGQAW